MKELNRTLNLPMLIFYGTGMILGAGIYSIIGKAAGETGDSLWMAFVLASISAFLTALSYAELSTMFPRAGAEFVYLREAFNKHKWIGSTAGVVMAYAGAATAATVSLSFAGYLNQFIESPQIIVALVVLVLFSIIAIIGIKESAWFTVGSTLIEVGGLIFIIYLGITSEKFGKALETMPHLGTLTGTALVIFSFFGFENIVNLAEESKEPEKDLPKAIIISVIISGILYFLVSLGALALLSAAKLSQSSAPLMSAAEAISKNYGKVLGGVALFSTANTALISLIGASRILYSMGKEKALPESVATTLPQRKTPWLASIIVLIASAMLLPLGKLEKIASVSSLTTMFAFFLVNVALIRLRYTHADTKRAFKIPLSIGKLAIIPLLAAIIALILLTQFVLTVYLIAGGLILVSSLVFLWREKGN